MDKQGKRLHNWNRTTDTVKIKGQNHGQSKKESQNSSRNISQCSVPKRNNSKTSEIIQHKYLILLKSDTLGKYNFIICTKFKKIKCSKTKERNI